MIDADKTVQSGVLVRLVSHVQRAYPQRHTTAGNGATGGPEVPMADIHLESRKQGIQPCSTKEGQWHRVARDAFGRGMPEMCAGQSDEVDSMAGFDLRCCQIERMPLGPTHVAREDDMGDGERRIWNRGHQGVP